jgi:hypothetical protein
MSLHTNKGNNPLRRYNHFLNIHAMNIGEPNYTKQTLQDLKEQIGSDTIIADDFTTPLSSKDYLFKKINKETSELHYDIEIKWTEYVL